MRADTQHRKTVRVKVPPHLSAEAIERFYAELQQALKDGAGIVAFDCSDVESVQSNHIAILWSAREMCETAAAQTILHEPTFGLRRVIHLLDLQDVFQTDGSDNVQPVDEAAEDRSGIGLVFVDRFEPNPQEVDRALQAFLDYLQRLGVPEEARFDLQTIFYEIATNISQHARLAPGEMVSLRAVPSYGSMELIFEDNGPHFDPTAGAREVNVREAARTGKTRGFGLPLIRKLADDMTYDRVDNRTNRLRLVKRWGVEE